MYKMVNNLAPDMLCSLIPSVPDPHLQAPNTRQKFDLPRFRARTVLFDKSFFPSTVRLWNELPVDIRKSPSISVFKSKISHPVERSLAFDELSNFGDRFNAIQHTRLRLGANQLNSYLCKIGVKDSATCQCGLASEDVWHYFFPVLYILSSVPNYTRK